LYRCLQERFGCLFAAGKPVVGERHIRSDENVVAYTQSIPKLHTAFHGDAVAYDNIVFDEAMRANITVAANLGAGQHGNKLPYARPRADVRGLNVGQRMNKGLIHA
jgi:hypothetical protein